MQNGQPTARVFRPVACGLGEAVVAHALGAVLFFLPHLRPARPAAERAALVALELGHFDADGLERLARRLEHAVVAAQVARVVEGDVGALLLGRVDLELAGRLELGDAPRQYDVKALIFSCEIALRR